MSSMGICHPKTDNCRIESPHTDSMTETSAILNHLFISRTVLNEGTDEELVCIGYRESARRLCLYYTLLVLTGGLLLLLFHWKPELKCYLRKSPCALYTADTVVLKDIYGKIYTCELQSLGEADELPLEYSNGYNREDILTDGTVDVDDAAKLTTKDDLKVRYFDHQHVRYLWNTKTKTYSALEDLSNNTKCVTIQEEFHGLSVFEQLQKRKVYGDNVVEIDVKSYWRLFIEEVLNPFYIFQVASIILWMSDQYYYYAGAILLISCISIGFRYKTKRQCVKNGHIVHNFVKKFHCWFYFIGEVPTRHLVPGDVLVVPPHGCIMTCDAVLITGTCIVNESMLTGESVPVTKTPLTQQEDEEIFSPERHKRHTLFAGTHVVQTRYYGQAKVTAVVVRTGFCTAKGDLVRGILFPKPLGFKFYQDSIRFIMFLFCVASLGMIYSIATYIRLKAYISKIVLRVLDIITIVVPPALPAAMTVGTVYAQNRLKKNGIFCISPPRINFCGQINIFCFDKTGTLTEDGLDMWGVLPIKDNNGFSGVVNFPRDLPRGPFLVCMATCHSLTIIDGELTGDPLDLIMFNSANWVLEEPGRDISKFETIMPTVVKPCSKDTFDASSVEQPFEVGIVRQFTFSSSLQRMSVMTRTLGENHMSLYCKGAPEKIASLCNPNTVPNDFQEILHKFTVQGFRVIAFSWKPLDPKLTWHQAQRLSRDKVEHNLQFLGLMILQNKLKPQTTPVIRTLNDACIRTVMVTGDMLQTAISVARNCGMVGAYEKVIIVNACPADKYSCARIQWEAAVAPLEEPVDSCIEYSENEYHLAVTGKSFSVLQSSFPELMQKICVKGTIFARMSPDQKCQLVEKLQEVGYSVGMCGDGANDCEALKAAHAGISLSEAEASVAAPFTSRVSNIECVVKVIKEGRAALVTSFGCFKYMALYSFIQFVSVLILYTFEANLGDWQFLYIDLCITTTVAVLMGYTDAFDKLVPEQPPSSLVELSNLLSIITQVVLVGLVQIAAFFYLQTQSWSVFFFFVFESESHAKCWEVTIIFLTSSYQYLIVAFCFSKGPPFRKPLYTNIPYLLSLVILFSITTFLVFIPPQFLGDFLQLMPLKEKPLLFRGLLISIVAAHFIGCMSLEYFITDSKVMKAFYNKVRKNKSVVAYKAVEKELRVLAWPPVGDITLAEDTSGGDDTYVTVQSGGASNLAIQ
ncbi:hypothetical protein ScPMuIL_008600 [Solemya velum]